MPRRKKQKPDLPATAPVAVEQPLTAVMGGLEQIKASQHAKAHVEPDAPRMEPSHVERVRPTGPRKRDGEPAASYTAKNTRVTKDGPMWQVEVYRDLTAQEHAKMQASGFDPVDDAGRIWNASQKTLAALGTDINIVAVKLDHKGEQRGR